MGLNIITAKERQATPRGVKALIAGPSGVGKTSLLRTLDPASTLFLDLEAGDLAVQDVPADTLRPQTWEECRELAALLGGPNLALSQSQSYSQDHYEYVCNKLGTDAKDLEKYQTYFIDSLSVAGRMCFRWCAQQPDAFSEKTGKPDIRGAYGLHGREMIAWLTQLQQARSKNVIFIVILDEGRDDFGQVSWGMQIEGSKTGRELPGIVDELITYQFVRFDGAEPARAFVCQYPNPFGYPAKDRSGRLDLYEPPDLGALIAKLTAAPLRAVA